MFSVGAITQGQRTAGFLMGFTSSVMLSLFLDLRSFDLVLDGISWL